MATCQRQQQQQKKKVAMGDGKKEVMEPLLWTKLVYMKKQCCHWTDLGSLIWNRLTVNEFGGYVDRCYQNFYIEIMCFMWEIFIWFIFI